MSANPPPRTAANPLPARGLRSLLAASALLAVGVPGSNGTNAAATPWELLGSPLGGTWLGLVLLLAIAGAWLQPKSRLNAWSRTVFGFVLAVTAAYALSQRVHAGRFDAAPALNDLLRAGTIPHALILASSIGILGTLMRKLLSPTSHDSAPKVLWGVATGWLVLGFLAPVALGADEATLAAVVEGVLAGPTSDTIAGVSFCLGLAWGAACPILHLNMTLRVNARYAVGTIWLLTFLVPLAATAAGSSYPDRWFEATESLKLSLALSGALLFAVAPAPCWATAARPAS